jgi:hypothetical protein
VALDAEPSTLPPAQDVEAANAGTALDRKNAEATTVATATIFATTVFWTS